jgi:hypothetical protein
MFTTLARSPTYEPMKSWRWVVAAASASEGNSLHLAEIARQELVRTVLNPPRDVRVGGTAVGWVVFETAVARRVVRRRDDDTVGKV